MRLRKVVERAGAYTRGGPNGKGKFLTMKTLMASGRIVPKGERPLRADRIVVIVNLEGEEARRFEKYRGNKCPREAMRELIFERLNQQQRSQ